MSRAVCIPLLIAAMMLLIALPASAHVTQTQGAYSVKVGWGDEPPASGTRNHITVQVWDSNSSAGITGLVHPNSRAQITVTVVHAGQMKTLEMAESDEDPGNYSAPILPTEEGLYTVHVAGQLDNTTSISQDFAIEPVENGADAAFPVHNDTTQSQIQDLQARVTALEAKARTTSSTPATVISSSPVASSPAKGTPALEVGLVVLGASAVALALARRR